VVSRRGAVEVPVKVTDEMTEGTVALPHGWGHRGGWQVANAAGGANSNLLMSADAEDLEPLAGMAHLNGVPVRLEAVPGAGPAGNGEAAAVTDNGATTAPASGAPTEAVPAG
jgi:formate dehydrogenase